MSGPEGPLSLFVWYSFTSGSEEPLEVTRDQLKGWLSDAGIDAAFLPPPARAVDAFRSATSGVTDEYDHGNKRVTLVVRETRQTKDFVMRQVFMTWYDESNRLLERRAADLQFFRPRRLATGRVAGTERLRTLVDQRTQGLDRERVSALVRRVEEAYKVNQQQLSPHAVRAVARTYLASLGAVAVAGSNGGAYLLPPRFRKEAEALREVVRQCGPGCRLRIIPLVDEPDLRDMVRASIEADLVARAQTLVREITEWETANPGGTPTTLRWNSWRGEKDILQDCLMAYTEEHDTTYPQAAGALERLVELVDALWLRVAANRRARR